VGRTLRRQREALGWKLDDAARVLECDRSKISRIESGQRGIRARELRELMDEYGVAEEQRDVRDVLTLLADPRGAFGWQRDYAAVLPAALRDYLVMETAAPAAPASRPARGRYLGRGSEGGRGQRAAVSRGTEEPQAPTDDLSAPDARWIKLAERLANRILAAQAEQHDGTSAPAALPDADRTSQSRACWVTQRWIRGAEEA
jgi:transcriptional regulator with XRE-family HTH domain